MQAYVIEQLGDPWQQLTLRETDAPSATDDLEVWVLAPPSSSAVTISLVTVFTTSGPVTNM